MKQLIKFKRRLRTIKSKSYKIKLQGNKTKYKKR